MAKDQLDARLNPTVAESLEKHYPTEFGNWDNWDFKIFGPLSLDDLALVSVILINQDGKRVECKLPI